MIIIPARISSTRFPKKVLVPINGIPMVIKTAKAVENIDNVVIATDSNEVIEVAKSYGFNAVMTKESHQSGTDRIYEASLKLGLSKDEIIINVQGDEPFIEEEVVKKVFDLTKENLKDSSILMNSCYKIISNEDANDPNLVKVVTNQENLALYFSRSKIPFIRDNEKIEYKGHLGLYGFTMSSLGTFCNLKTSILEKVEKLEQLRALDANYKIAMTKVETKSFGIDTKEDLQKALKIW